MYTAMRSSISASLDRDIARLAIPALGALAADPLVSMVDTVFVGRLGVVPLAALGVNTSIFAMAFVVFNFLAYGTTPLVARAVGRGDRAGAGDVVMQAFLLAALVGGTATLLLELLAVPIVSLMGAGGELRDPALSYLRIRALAGPAVLLVTAGHGYLTARFSDRPLISENRGHPVAFVVPLGSVAEHQIAGQRRFRLVVGKHVAQLDSMCHRFHALRVQLVQQFEIVDDLTELGRHFVDLFVG